MTDIIFTRLYHSLEEEFGSFSKFGTVEMSNGICWLAAVTRQHGFNTKIIDALPLKLDNERLAEAILELLQDPKKARQMGLEGRRIAEERFDERQVFDKVKAEYARLLGERGFSVPKPQDG